MATNADARAAGFITPEPYDLVRGGDDAISTNARTALDLVNATSRHANNLVSSRFTTGKNLVNTDPIATHGPQSYWTDGTSPTPNTSAAYAAYTATKPFPVRAHQKYTGSKTATIHFLDVAGNRIPGAWTLNTNWNNPITVTAPFEAAFAAVTYSTVQASAVQLEEGDTATAPEPYVVVVPRLGGSDGSALATRGDLDAALAPFPAHDYIDVWTSPVFDDGRNVWVPGQPAAATTASAPAAAGATTLTVAAADLVPGMSLVTVPTTAAGQTFRVASVSGNVLTLAAPLAHPIASGQRMDPLWQNASHLGASSNGALPGYAALARWVFERLADLIPAPSKVTILGNSWPVQGANSLAAQAATTYPSATWVNAGVGGNNTAALLARFATDVPADSDVVLLFEHVNDAYQGVDAVTQAANWRALIEKVHALGAWPVVIGPPPLSEYPTRALTQEHATTDHAGTSLRVLQLERTVAALGAP